MVMRHQGQTAEFRPSLAILTSFAISGAFYPFLSSLFHRRFDFPSCLFITANPSMRRFKAPLQGRH
jgi:hypothetical protein